MSNNKDEATEENTLNAVWFFDDEIYNSLSEEGKFSLLLGIHELVGFQMKKLIVDSHTPKNNEA